MANINHANYVPSFLKDALESGSQTWASGNTKTITNANVKSTSRIFLMWSVPINETPGIVCSNGSFVITLNNALTNVTFKYFVC